MKKLALRLAQSIFSNISYSLKKTIITYLAAAFNVSLLRVAYNNIGILNYKDSKESGEDFILQTFLNGFLSERENQVLFDVGSNVGSYAKLLSINFPDAEVFSFEPNPSTFKILTDNLSQSKKVHLFNLGLSKEEKNAQIYAYTKEESTSHASLYSDVFTALHKDTQLNTIDIKLTTIDKFCKEYSIDQIDFLKIDTEGHEYEVLQGARQMLAIGNIQFIQFEFNEMNVISRVFLKDFYDLLPNFKFYRINSNSLIPLGDYRSEYEIFQFQNILAVLNEDV